MPTSHNPFEPPQVDAVTSAPSGQEPDADRIRREHLNTETHIRSLGLLYILGGVVGTLAMLGMFLAVIIPAVFGKGSRMSLAELLILIPLLALYPLLLVTGVSLRRFKPWSRWVAVAFSSLGLLGIPIGTLISGFFLYTLLNSKGSVVFTPQYARIVEQTPHIKYKTPTLAWILLGVILLGIAAAVLIPLLA